jgi:hypothetical protein
MRASRGFWAILLATVVLILGGAALYVLASTAVGRCYLVSWSGLDQIAPNLYVDPDMPEAQRQSLLSRLADSEKQVASLYGSYTARPTVIAGHTMAVMDDYGGNLYNRAGRTYLTLASAFIVLGPDGVRSEDVLSHELAHAELLARIGYWSRGEIPNWFDEGLAVQFDNRYRFAEWAVEADDGRAAYDLDQLGVIKHDDWLAYAGAKQEVNRWLATVGQAGLLALLQAIQSGEAFQPAYDAIERKHSEAQ